MKTPKSATTTATPIADEIAALDDTIRTAQASLRDVWNVPHGEAVRRIAGAAKTIKDARKRIGVLRRRQERAKNGAEATE